MTTVKQQAQAAATAAAMVRAGETEGAEACSLVGAVIGDWIVLDRVRPGSHWTYRCRHRTTGQVTGHRGHELVRLARAARLGGLPVVMSGAPWRDEDASSQSNDRHVPEPTVSTRENGR